MNSVVSVFDRITEIKEKMESFFGHKRKIQTQEPQGLNFKSLLEDKLSKQNDTSSVKLDLSSTGHSKIDLAIKKASQTYDLPGSLINAVIKNESNYNPNAISPKGAQGLMQLMPQTAQELNVENPFSIQENVMGGSKYLKTLMGNYKGDLVKALAAYNAGPSSIKNDKLPNYPETTQYVKKVINQYLKNSGLTE